MAVNRKVAETYLKTFLERLRQEPEELTKHERRIGSKYLKSLERAHKATADGKQLQEQIAQAQARIRSLELQCQDNLGKAEAFLDTIIVLHFDDEVEGEGESAVPEELPLLEKEDRVLEDVSDDVEAVAAATA